MIKHDCYDCNFRRKIPGDAHSKCTNPKSSDELNIEANPIGRKGGWFNWPVNFDPLWLENCDGFEIRK